jgi:hypothetical protein
MVYGAWQTWWSNIFEFSYGGMTWKHAPTFLFFFSKSYKHNLKFIKLAQIIKT